ncbi:MAG TPA: TlpA disulfide reductase family protein [Lacibacter sp.]|nr:TlpA disulfide reductase family protein [Lacibacter sp.]
MKKYFLICLIAVITTSLPAQINFTVTGKIIADTTNEIFVSYDGQKSIVQILKNGSFSFSGKAKNPCIATIVFGKDEEEQQLWLDSGRMEITVEKVVEQGISSKQLFEITSVKGPETSESYFKINKLRRELYTKVDYIGDPAVRNDSVYKRIFSMVDHFVTKYPCSNLSIDFIRLFGLNFKEKEMLFNKLDTSCNTNNIEFLSTEIEREKILAPGNMINDFSMAKPDGAVFHLNQLQSNYVLLEFWSSWCAPCRTMRPGLSGLYKKYHEKGLEIVGISLDENKVDWIKAIEKDNVPWVEISDLKGFKSTLAFKYKINAIPYWILIDKNRKIIQTGFWTVPEQTLQKLMP